MLKLWLLGLIFSVVAIAGAAVSAQADDLRRLAILSPASAPVDSVRSFTLPELAKAGFVEGRNLVIDARVGPLSDLPRLAVELIANHPDAVIAVGGAAIRAVQAASKTTPIVGAFIGEDPVKAGFATSLARPGGSVTGVVMLAPELDGKRLDLLREATPQGMIAVLAVDRGRDEPNTSAMARVADRAGFEIQMFYASTSAEYPAIFDAMQRAGVVALGIVSSPEFATNIVDIAALAQKARLPTMCEWSWMAERGCLFSYGPIFSELHRRSAFYLAKIFRGTPPGELPMELPVHFELVINFKVAKALGFTVPQTFIERADRVIE